jgi:hypothetical protein
VNTFGIAIVLLLNGKMIAKMKKGLQQNKNAPIVKKKQTIKIYNVYWGGMSHFLPTFLNIKFQKYICILNGHIQFAQHIQLLSKLQHLVSHGFLCLPNKIIILVTLHPIS